MEALRLALLRYRQFNNITQQQLADKLGVTRGSVANWELGRSIPDTAMCKHISEILQIDLNVLLGNEKKESTEIDAKIALYNQVNSLTEEQAKDILNYIEFVKSKK